MSRVGMLDDLIARCDLALTKQALEDGTFYWREQLRVMAAQHEGVIPLPRTWRTKTRNQRKLDRQRRRR